MLVTPLPEESLEIVFVATLVLAQGSMEGLGGEEPSERVAVYFESAPRSLCCIRQLFAKVLYGQLVFFSAFLDLVGMVVCLFAPYIQRLYCAPHSTCSDITGVISTLLLLRYHVITSLYGLFVGSSSPGGGTLVSFSYVVAY